MLIFVHQKMPAAAVPAAAAIAAALGCRSIPASLHPLRFKMRPTYRYLQIMASASQMQVNTFPAAAASEDGVVVTNLLDKLRSRISKDATKPKTKKELSVIKKDGNEVASVTTMATNFRELGLSDELMAAVEELKISVPTEVQSLAIPAVLDGENVVVASHTGSGKTLAYMLPIVQALRNDEAAEGKMVKAKRPRAVVLCPTRELAEQVLHVAKSICHHARFRSALISGGFRPRLQEDVLSLPIDMVVGTPGRLLVHVEEGNLAYGEIKYVVLDEADTMFDQGFGPEVRKFLAPLRNRASQPGGKSFQTVLVTATITKAVQKLLDEEFPGIKHIHTSTLHKKIASARHHFIRLKGNENKLEVLSQVLEPLIAKKDSVMVFCNTVGSCRAVDYYLQENNIPTVNYHGEVPAEDRNQNLNKFKNAAEGNTIPALVCTDLAARGLDLVVDHVIMFDFPRNSIDYLHRTGRTARMGAKGKITSLVGKRDLTLAEQIEDTISKGGTLEAVISNREELKAAKEKELKEKQKTKAKLIKGGKTQANERVRFKAVNNKWSKMKKPAVKEGTNPFATSKLSKRAVKEGSKPFASSKFTKTRTKTSAVQKARIIKDKEQPKVGGTRLGEVVKKVRLGEVVKKVRTLQRR